MDHLSTALMSVIGAVIILMLGAILNRLVKVEDKLDAKVDKSYCEKAQQAEGRELERIFACKERDHEDLWDAFNRHCHTGLPVDSKVTR